MAMMMTMAPPTVTAGESFLPRVARPHTMATAMKSSEIMAVRMLAKLEFSAFVSASPSRPVVGTTAKVLATMDANAATTSTRVR